VKFLGAGRDLQLHCMRYGNPLINYSIKWQVHQRHLGELKFKSTSDSMWWLWKNLGFRKNRPYIRADRRGTWGISGGAADLQRVEATCTACSTRRYQ